MSFSPRTRSNSSSSSSLSSLPDAERESADWYDSSEVVDVVRLSGGGDRWDREDVPRDDPLLPVLRGVLSVGDFLSLLPFSLAAANFLSLEGAGEGGLNCAGVRAAGWAMASPLTAMAVASPVGGLLRRQGRRFLAELRETRSLSVREGERVGLLF